MTDKRLIEVAFPWSRCPSTRSTRRTSGTAGDGFDFICTDPPYYDAIPYSDLMDFFHVWLRRALRGLSPAIDTPLGPKWDAAANDGELIDDAARFGGDREASRRHYEEGMARAFARFHGKRASGGEPGDDESDPDDAGADDGPGAAGGRRWRDVRAEVHVKERYFDRVVRNRGLHRAPGGGRKPLGEEAAGRIDAIRRRCPDDFDNLARRLEAAVGNRTRPA